MDEKNGFDVTAVLRTVLYLLDQTEYPEKNSNAIVELRTCMRQAITHIESETRTRPN